MLPQDDDRITPVAELFTYHIFGRPKQLQRWQADNNSYSLVITGLVDPPLRLSLGQIRDDFQPVAADMVLQCTTNVHWGRVRFTGARLLDVLRSAGTPSVAHAGLPEAAYKVALHGADGFDANLRVEELCEQPDAFLLAYAMNDEPIPPDHGFPVRMTADGKYGFKWCKWLTEVELVDYDYKGHYEGKRGWSDTATRGQLVI
jgi:DMSO/TMAO reductase YedYZ molybdopterin-dependent catalytic subunit